MESKITPTNVLDDQGLDQTLRPKSFSEYVGQENIKENLRIILGAAKKRSETTEHLLLHGPSGLGKTTLAYLIAKELGSSIKITSGTALEKAGDVGEDMYYKAVDQVATKYSKMSVVAKDEVDDMAAELKKQWKLVAKGLNKVKHSVK